MVEVDGKVLVIDSGPDFRQQLLREKVQRLDAVIFTHEHKDHTAGLDDVRPFNFKQGGDIDVYAHPRVQDALKREYQYIFREGLKYPDLPHIKLNTIGNDPFEVKGINVIPIEVLHYKLPVLGFRIGDFTYVTDASTISKQEKKKINGSRVLVLNALRKEKHISHFTLDEAVALMEELKPEQGYLIHMSHQIGFHEQLNHSLPKNVQLAYDGLEVTI